MFASPSSPILVLTLSHPILAADELCCVSSILSIVALTRIFVFSRIPKERYHPYMAWFT